MSMFNDIECWTHNNEQTSLATEAEVTEYAKSVGLDQKMYGIVRYPEHTKNAWNSFARENGTEF